MTDRLNAGLGTAMAAAMVMIGAGAAQAATLRIDFTNDAPADGLFFTPLLGVFHDGTFDSFNVGSRASDGVTDVAEEGFVTRQAALAQGAGAKTAVGLGVAGVNPPPVIDPGETASFTIDLDPSTDRYFSFLSMVIPSNDTFIGNDDPLAYRLFDDDGNFALTGPIEVGLGQVWDAGTEANLATGADGAGAAFTPGFEVGGGTRTDGVIASVSDLDYLLGLGRVPGGTVGFVPGAGTSLATIRISAVDLAPVPVPAAAPLLLAGLGAFGVLRLRRRKRL